MTDNAEIAKAKALALGLFGELVGRFPLLFAKPAFFGQRPSRNGPVDIQNGTASLVDLGDGPMAITCQHVIAAVRQRKLEAEPMIFQLGHTEVDPLEQLIDENERLDVATIRLTESQADAITSESEIGSCFFKPVSWPPPLPKQGEFVAFGGFPGTLRSVLSFNEIEFRAWSNGASEVASAGEFQFVSPFQREYWVASSNSTSGINFSSLGGLSGGPVFIKRPLYWEIVGIVKEYHDGYDTVLFSPLRSIRQNGTIEAPPV